MYLITKSMLIRGIAKKWREKYPAGCAENKDAIYEKLLRLPESASEIDVAKIIGNSSWTSSSCDECNQECDKAVVVGDGSDYEASVCPECLLKALSLIIRDGA